MILAAGLSPAWQQIVLLDALRLGEVNRARDVQWCASGKVLNVGLALHHLGAECRTLAPLGGAFGAAIDREFQALGAPHRWVPTAAATRVCTTVLDKASGTTTELVENAGALTAKEVAAYVAAYAELAAAAQIVVLTGSLPAGVPASLYGELLSRTPGHAILDFRGPELLAAVAHKPLLVKPNREELGQTVNRSVHDEYGLRGAMHELRDSGAQWVLISEGAEMAWLVGPQGDVYRLMPATVDVVNPIGCGDCLAAGIAAALAVGRPMPQAVCYGFAAAAENARQLLPARLNPAAVAVLEARVEIVRVA